MAFSSEQSPKEAVADIRKRLAQIWRAKSGTPARAQRTLAKKLTGSIELTATRITPEIGDLGFDLL
jgi:hypothetical protein